MIADYNSCNPFQHAQIERRVWRTGQTRAVRVRLLVIENTIESYIPRLHEEKLRAARSVLRLFPRPCDFVDGRPSGEFVRQSRAVYAKVVAGAVAGRRQRRVRTSDGHELVELIERMYGATGEYVGLPSPNALSSPASSSALASPASSDAECPLSEWD